MPYFTHPVSFDPVHLFWEIAWIQGLRNLCGLAYANYLTNFIFCCENTRMKVA